MTALLQMFQSSTQHRSGGVQEDALMAVSTLVEILGEGFIKYMDAFKPFLLIGLKNVAEYQVCHAAVGLVGDICRALGNKIVLVSDEIMEVLMTNLSDSSVHRTVKPQILSIFGDLALAIGTGFVKYLDLVMTLIFAFGLTFQLPVVLALLAKVGMVTVKALRDMRRYALVGLFGLAAIFTPPDAFSMLSLAVPLVALYEVSIVLVYFIERKRRKEDELRAKADAA